MFGAMSDLDKFQAETNRRKIRRENVGFLTGLLLLLGWFMIEVLFTRDNYRIFLATASLVIYTTLVYLAAFKPRRCPRCKSNMERLPLLWRVDEAVFENTHKFICSTCGSIKDTHIGPSSGS